MEFEEFDINSYFKMIEKMTVFESRIIIGMHDVTKIEYAIE